MNGNSRKSYFSRNPALALANKEKKGIRHAKRLQEQLEKVLKVARGTARRLRRVGMVQKSA